MTTSTPEKPFIDLSSYEPPTGYYDELVDAFGEKRTSWQTAWPELEKLSLEGIAERDQLLQRLIQENGITYNVYSGSEDSTRLWTMDSLPMIFENSEWNMIADSMRQRVRLLNALARDFYGPKKLLTDGHYPVSLVLGNPGFLRPCHQFQPKNGNWIHLYAADLARAPDGSWWVLSDRLEAPSGIGYSLENRGLSSRVLPELLRKTQVKRLQPFISKFHESYAQLAPHGKPDPTIAVLTPGPANETYFEHSYLARNLGYPLVEGADLTVRENKLYLKTIEGLQQIDVLIRRLDGSWCDPLELRSESLLGVPGLVNVVREGNVAIANALGTGVLESPALPAFLPNLCQHILGEELKMPSVATWWCGQTRERAYVFENLEHLVIKRTFRQTNRDSYFGPHLSATEREALKQEILVNPEQWCAQEIVSRATTPVYQNGGITPRHFLIRVFMIPHDDDWIIMPGGLGRIAPQTDLVNVSMQNGGLSKDIWLTHKGDSHKTTAREESRAHRSQAGTWRPQLPSRLADNLCWLGRYAERTEHLARITRVLVEAIVEPEGPDPLDGMGRLLQAMIPAEDFPRLKIDRPTEWDFSATINVLSALIWDPKMPGSLVDNITQIQRTAATVRERLSNDATQTLRKLSIPKSPKHDSPLDEESFGFLEETIDRLSAFSGVVMENMTRGHGWVFLEIGRRMERAVNITTMLRTSLSQASDDIAAVLEHLLACLDSTLTYRRQHLNFVELEAVLELVIWNKDNPRSIQFQLESVQALIKRLPHLKTEGARHPLDQAVARAIGRIEVFNTNLLSENAFLETSTELDGFLEMLQKDILIISDRISEHYFAITQQTENIRRPLLQTPNSF
ncbi:MAG: circularly permuted type 2 ATP-grasp protein [Opitutales bacterium]